MPKKERVVTHPTREGVRAAYGWSPSGFHAALQSPEDSYAHANMVRSHHLADVLAALIEWGFFDANAPSLALQQLTFLLPDEMDDPELARCARVIVGLRRAAD